MKAAVGDRLVVRGPHLGEPERGGEILEVRHPDGSPPYVVRWDADGHVGLYVPSSDSRLVPVPRKRSSKKKA